MRGRPQLAVSLLVAVAACDHAQPIENTRDDPAGERGPTLAPVPASVQPEPASLQAAPPATVADVASDLPPPEPLQTRTTARGVMVYASPDFDAPFRGKIQRGQSFAVFALVEGDRRCRSDGWGRIGTSAYACLQWSAVTRDAPVSLPVVAPGRLLPFYYARRRGQTQPDPPAAPRWRHRAALRRGDPPLDELALEYDYAFVRRYQDTLYVRGDPADAVRARGERLRCPHFSALVRHAG